MHVQNIIIITAANVGRWNYVSAMVGNINNVIPETHAEAKTKRHTAIAAAKSHDDRDATDNDAIIYTADNREAALKLFSCMQENQLR